MAEAVIDIVLSNGQKAGTTIKELQQQANRLKREINDLTPGSEEFVKKSGDFQKVTGRLGDVRKQVSGVKKEQEGLVSSFLKMVPFGGQVEQLGGRFRGLRGNVGGLTGGFKSLRAAIIGTGIGALLVLITMLVGWLTKTQKGMEFVEKATAAVSAVFSVLFDRSMKVIEALGSFLKGNFSQGFDQLKESVRGVGEEMARETRLAWQLREALLAIEKTENDLILQRAATRAQVKELNMIAEDTTKSYSERAAAAQKAIDIERQLLDQQVTTQRQRAANLLGLFDLTEERLEEIKKNGLRLEDVGFSESTEADRKEAIEELAKLFQLQESSLELQTTLQNKLNTIQNQAAAEAEKRRQDREKKSEEERKREEAAEQERLKREQEFQQEQLRLTSFTAEEKRAKLKTALSMQLIDQKEYADGLEVVEEERLKKILGLNILFYKEDSAAAQKARLDLDNFLADQRIKEQEDEKASKEKILQERLQQIANIESAAAFKLEEERAYNLISEQEYQQALSDIQQEALETRLQAIVDHHGKSSQEAIDAQNDLNKFLLDAYKKDAENVKNAEEEKRSRRQRTIAVSLGAASQFNDLQIAMEQDRLAALKENLGEGQSLRKSEYNKLKKQQKTQTVIAGITEVANIWSTAMQLGPIAGPILGAILTALAVARTVKNINAFESQKFGLGGRIKAVRRLAMGGMLRGPLHRDGGIPGVVKSTGQPIEMEDGEIILNRRVGLDPAGLAAASELNHRYGGVKFFQTGGPINPISSIASGSSSAASNNSQAGAEFARESLELQRQQIAETAALRSDVTSWQTNLKVNNNVNETREGINVINKLETDAAF